MNNQKINPDDFVSSDDFNEKSYWRKIQKYAKKAGYEVVQKSLWLYFSARSSKTPAWAKAIIYTSLAYFVFPLDAIPDILPVVGYTDDLSVLAAAVATVAFYIDEDVKAKAQEKLIQWF
ncbi:YkvA family protein [Neisseria sp. Ec49-e6-T10]|uniref:YkvA family protein n=1 Tax=Neisseria sp. Ec49-e6-T10 TaxID=3140744 RepID=UPI003EB926D6